MTRLPSFPSSTSCDHSPLASSKRFSLQPSSTPQHGFQSHNSKVTGRQQIFHDWVTQFYGLYVSCLLFTVYFIYHILTVYYQPAKYPLICTEAPFESWIRPYMLLITGASTGQCLALWFRHIFTLKGPIDPQQELRVNSLQIKRHPKAAKMMLAIATIKAITSIGFYSNVIPTTCVDFHGVKTNYFMWFEWLTTVPHMFFLVAMMGTVKESSTQHRSSPAQRDRWMIHFCATTSLPALFIPNLPWIRSVSWLSWLLFIYANITMAVAMITQQWRAWEYYTTAKTIFDRVVSFQPIDRHLQTAQSSYAEKDTSQGEQGSMKASASTSEKQPMTTSSNNKARMFATKEIEQQCYDNLCVAQCKMNCSLFLTFFFALFPTLYYCACFQVIDSEMYILLTYIASYCSKILFTHIMADSHIEILDPNKFLLLEQRRAIEDSRFMFLRYVFHEVRVPLNSIVLGTQLLKDNSIVRCSSARDSSCRQTENELQETLSLMSDATSYMSDTLNDVLSLQKIQQGQIDLEYKEISIIPMLTSVLAGFRLVTNTRTITYIELTFTSYIEQI